MATRARDGRGCCSAWSDSVRQCELFGAHLSELLNREHPLYVLAERIDWSQFEARRSTIYQRRLDSTYQFPWLLPAYEH